MRRGLSLVFLVIWGCGASDPEPQAIVPLGESHGMVACNDQPECSAFRGVGGISMGGGTAMRIVLEDPTLFDLGVSLGSPYIDLEYFLFSVGKLSNGGFCTPDQLMPDHLSELDQKDNPSVWCGPIHYDELAIPNTTCDGFSGDFNHHYRGAPAGRGGSFNRVGSFEIVQDFALAYGNPAFYNPDSKYLPPGVPADHHVPLTAMGAERGALERNICDHPTVFEGRYDRLYNPTGEYPMITFCDGDGPENGVFEPGTNNYPVEVALAVDYNRNGRRDYAEPVAAQPTEYIFDVGLDGLADVDEPGYDPINNKDPSGDDYHWLDNPTGAELNFRHEEGEPYDDFGLDGVASTGDYGEGNGQFDVNPNIEYTFSRSPRQLIERVSDAQLARLHFWADAGIRDFLLSSQITNQFWGALKHRVPDSQQYFDWSGLAEATLGGGTYDGNQADLSAERIGRHAYLHYGDPSVCPGIDEETGRGNHVGSAQEALDRITTSVAFASARFAGGDFTGLSGGISDQGSPNGSFTDFVVNERYDSPALGRSQPYTVVLPPDYFENPEARYPVFYFLHGQGQKASESSAVALLVLTPQMTSMNEDKQRSRRSDWQKMIIVFADGECQVGECHTGTFYLDHMGLDGHGVRHGEAFFELMRLVETRFRTKVPGTMQPL